MPQQITPQKIAQYRRDIVTFAEEQFYIPGKRMGAELIKLEPHQKIVLREAFKQDEDGNIPYDLITYSAPKKSGKSCVGSLIALWYALTQEPYNELFSCANDREQAQARIFTGVERAIKFNPGLRDACKIRQRDIEFPNGTRLVCLSKDYASAAGSNMGLATFDELWAMASENSRRFWEELPPVPTRRNSMRVVVTYAGFIGESDLLWDIYEKTVRPHYQIHPELPIYVNGKSFVYWDHVGRMPWQTPEYYERERNAPGMRVNTYLRIHENRWVTAESAYIDMEKYDACTDRTHRALMPNKMTPLFVGIDASAVRDSTAVVACYFDDEDKRVKLACHRIWTPTRAEPLDLEQTIEAYVLKLHSEYRLAKVSYDPYQMQRSATTLERAGVPVERFTQDRKYLIPMAQNLYDLVNGYNLVVYPDEELRKQMASAVAVETPQGFVIRKERSAHKIDAVIALAMAAYGAMQGRHLLSASLGDMGSFTKGSTWTNQGRADEDLFGISDERREGGMRMSNRSRWRV